MTPDERGAQNRTWPHFLTPPPPHPPTPRPQAWARAQSATEIGGSGRVVLELGVGVWGDQKHPSLGEVAHSSQQAEAVWSHAAAALSSGRGGQQRKRLRRRESMSRFYDTHVRVFHGVTEASAKQVSGNGEDGDGEGGRVGGLAVSRVKCRFWVWRVSCHHD